MRSRTPVALVAAMALAATGFAACGDDDEDTGASPPPPSAAAETATTGGGAGGGGETVEVATDPGGDIAFQQDALTAPAGSVTFEFTNQANIPHDFKIEKGGEEVGGTEVVTGGSAEANVELEAGEYTFYCSVGDHREDGMEGKLTVE